MPVEDKLAEREPPATAAVSQHEDSPATIQYSIPRSAGTMPQVLDIEPPRELVFTGPFTEAATATLTLHNPSEKIVCFIVKTTAPAQYCICPHTGFITPGQSKTITVMLQSLDSINPAVVPRHKFKVLTCFVLNVDFVDLKGIWKQVDPVQLMESELMTVFEQPPATAAVSQHGHEDSAASIQDSSPSEEKISQVLVIDPPHELVFTGPFTDVANATLTLHNPSEKTVCFKIDTTSPKQYCISPNPGIITPGQSKTIDVVHQPLDINPAEVHKFMVQTCFAPDVDLEDIWTTIDPAQLMHSGLMVVFEQPRAPVDVPQHHVGCEESLATPTTSETPVPPEEDVVILNDLIKEQDRYDQTQRALYGAMDDSVCTYPEGYKPRQPVLLCVTCATEDKQAGVCLGCASHCHDGHELLELFSKRNFRCDCGNEKFGGQKCTLYENKAPVNEYNSYNHNFSGLYCVCNDTYPGETEEEMIQCRMCEDWFHLSHMNVDTSLDKWKAVLAGLNSLVCRDCASTSKFPFMAVFEAADTPKCFAAFVAANPQPPSPIPQPLSLIPDWQKTICSCDKCKDIMDKCGCLFLLDDQDDLEKYEAENEAGAMTDDQQDAEVVNQLVGSVGRDGAAAVLQGYNELKRNLAEFLYTKADKNEVIKKEDVDGFFAQLKKRRRLNEDE